MITTSVFKCGHAHRRADGKALHWTFGNANYKSLEQVQSWIRELYRLNDERETPLPPDEFVPVEIITRVYVAADKESEAA